MPEIPVEELEHNQIVMDAEGHPYKVYDVQTFEPYDSVQVRTYGPAGTLIFAKRKGDTMEVIDPDEVLRKAVD